ncbi:MAG: DUF4468 domain-containing protein [Dehalococcoidia bacterium]|nr:MAG: DUF4468 domain-containing protein [Dehalococcoidia bacterium]
MKKLKLILVLFIISIASQSIAQLNIEKIKKYFPVENKKITYTKIVKLDSSYTSELLYKNAKKWIIDQFKSGKDVIQSEDKEQLYIIGKGFFQHNLCHMLLFTSECKYWFTVNIEVKDGRYKYTVYDVIYNYRLTINNTSQYIREPFEVYLSNANNSKRTREYYTAIASEFNSIIKNLENSMIIKEHSDW